MVLEAVLRDRLVVIHGSRIKRKHKESLAHGLGSVDLVLGIVLFCSLEMLTENI